MAGTHMERALRKLDVGLCWEWTGARDKHGYGRFESPHGYLAHRFFWIELVGPIPGLVIDHLCRNTRCCNPDHLEPVTQAENMRRAHGAAAMHAAKTHCPRGHEYTTENTYIDKRGSRNCRACRRSGPSGYCSNGHEYTPENTRIEKRGSRRCITCSRRRSRDWARKKKRESHD